MSDDIERQLSEARDEIVRLRARERLLAQLLWEARATIFEDADVHDVRDRIDAALADQEIPR